jgi:DNA-binding response OmpR family regulator
MCAMKEETCKRVLIIDDDIDLLMLLERRLKKEGFEVETAISLPEAEELFTYFAPHLVVLDINVNGQDGRQLCWKLKKLDPDQDIKVIMISGFDINPVRAALFGADDIVPKPFNLDYLVAKIDRLFYYPHYR